MARVSLDGLRANRPQADQAKLDATTEEDIRRHTIEDGGDPDEEPAGYRVMPAPAAIRRKLGVTQQDFADVLGVPLATYRNWEQGRKIPDPAARSLLTIFDREPEAALRALSPNRAVLPGKA
ncbi:MAG TPA: helix-turn-helix domain-containing protein [Methylobacterium sp.]